MKLYIMTDLEAVAGVLNSADWLDSTGRYYEKAKRLLTEEVNAGIRGFSEGGFHEIVVADGHGHGGIDVELLDKRAMLMRGWPKKPYPFGLDKTYSAVAFITGTDFGAQNGPFISPQTYRELYKPFHKKVNSWIHKNTMWKTFIHSCGSVVSFIEDFIEAGFDILNPVQCSAKDMNPQHLKEEFGDRISFWGGGVDTQKTLPFGSPPEVCNEVKERLQIFGKNGGFVFNTVHNIQANTPIENVVAIFDALKNYQRISG